MPSINGRYAERKIFAQVAIFRPSPITDFTHEVATALIDTGATISGLSRSLCDKLQLTSRGKRVLGTATADHPVAAFVFRLGIYPPEAQFPFMFEMLDGFSWNAEKSFDVILGMDILQQCRLVVDRDQTWSLTFG